MTKRVILLIPEKLTFDQLTEDQQTAIRGIFGQYVMPMPSTVAVNGLQVCDALASDAFNPDNIALLGLDWEILGMWNEQNQVLIPLDRTVFTEYLAPVNTYDEEGTELTSEPATFHEPHRWAGWSDWNA